MAKAFCFLRVFPRNKGDFLNKPANFLKQDTATHSITNMYRNEKLLNCIQIQKANWASVLDGFLKNK